MRICFEARRKRSGAGLPSATISAENRCRSANNGISPVSVKVSRIFARLPEEATHFRWVKIGSISRTPATARSSARNASASPARTRSRKSTGSARPHAASMRSTTERMLMPV